MAGTAWQAAVEALEAEGVEYAFGLSGNPLHLVADLHGTSVKPILARNESSAVYMAYGYARVARRVGICFGNPGPGTTNMVSGLLEAERFSPAGFACRDRATADGWQALLLERG